MNQGERARPAIGFIGLGLMGHAFTKRLCACGYRVTGYDIAADKLEAAARHGVQRAASAAAVTRASDIVQICVMTAADLEAAVFGEDGVAAAARPGKILVDHSTTEVETTKRFAARLAETGMGWIDAPVSGGPPAAEAGTLAIMAGGDDAHLARARDLLADSASAPTWARSAPARSPRW